MDRAGVEAMVCICLDAEACPETLAGMLVTSAEGLPFLVEVLLAAWVGSGVLVRQSQGWEVNRGKNAPVAPLTFADSVHRRLLTLGPETRAVLEVAAILGRHFDWTLLPEASGLCERHVLERFYSAIEAQLVAVAPRAAYPQAVGRIVRAAPSGSDMRSRVTPFSPSSFLRVLSERLLFLVQTQRGYCAIAGPTTVGAAATGGPPFAPIAQQAA